MLKHMSLSVKGALAWNENLRNLRGTITVDGKTLNTVQEVRAFLENELAKGHELLPFGDCEGFDYINGCPGHEEEKTN